MVCTSDEPTNTLTCYVKAVQKEDGSIGYGILWPDYPEYTQGGLWENSTDDIDTVEFKLIVTVKQQALSIDPNCHHELAIVVTNPSAYINLDTKRDMGFISHDDEDPFSQDVFAMASENHH